MSEEQRKARIQHLEGVLSGLRNDAHYWDLRRAHGDFSHEVLTHLERCARIQARGENRT